MVFFGIIQCFRNVRYFWCHVDGNPFVCLWSEECMDTLVMARLESGFCNDIFSGMDQAVKCDDRSLMDSHTF